MQTRLLAHWACLLHRAFWSTRWTWSHSKSPSSSQAASLVCLCESGRPQHLVSVILESGGGIFLFRTLQSSSCLEKRFCLTLFGLRGTKGSD